MSRYDERRDGGNLNNNLYFLLLGLGVDDAFVLTSEFRRHGDSDGAERIAMTCRTGGISVPLRSRRRFVDWAIHIRISRYK